MIIKLEYRGKSFAYDDEDMTVLQGIAVEEHIKGSLVDWDQGLGQHRSACYQALGWLVFHDGNPEVPIATVDFPIVKLSAAWLQARIAQIAEMQARAEAAAADAADAAAADAAPAKAAPPDPTADPGSGEPSGST